VSKERSELFREVSEAFRRHGQGQDAMDAAAAAFLGVHRTDLALLDLLQLGVRMSAGELARQGRLSPAAVTAALDRLERAGYVRRMGDEHDRRRVLVEVTERMAEQAEKVYGPLAKRGQELMAAYTDDQLRTLRDLLLLGAEVQLEQAGRVRDELSAERAAQPRPAAGTSAG